jgi:SAM-dependent methyltransferase
VPFVPTPQPIVDLMLRMAEVKKSDVVYDLGCGDGRLVTLAATTFGARGVGIEIDPELVARAKKTAAAAKVEHLVEFRLGDLFQSDFHDATVLTLYLFEEINERLRPQIFAQVKPGTRVVSHAFRIGAWEPDAERTVRLTDWTYQLFLWVVPANINGTWKLGSGSSHSGLPATFVVEQKFQRFTVRDSNNGEILGEGSLKGTDFALTLKNTSGTKPISINGRCEGNRLIGLPATTARTWKAEREFGTDKPL